MKKERAILIHLQVGRESTYCGRGDNNGAFATRDISKVTCPRCKPCLHLLVPYTEEGTKYRYRCERCGKKLILASGIKK
jgi:phage FluMu protein Com